MRFLKERVRSACLTSKATSRNGRTNIAIRIRAPPSSGAARAYQPTGSIWYFPQTYRLDEHQKYLLMSPGRDRAGTIGFRCVVDAQ